MAVNYCKLGIYTIAAILADKKMCFTAHFWIKKMRKRFGGMKISGNFASFLKHKTIVLLFSLKSK